MKRERYFYRDIGTDKVRFTRGEFQGWTEPSGPLKVPYAIFQNRSGTLYVPIYALTKETRAALRAIEEQSLSNDRAALDEVTLMAEEDGTNL